MWSIKKYIQDELAAAVAVDGEPTCATPDTVCTCGGDLVSFHRDSVRPLALLVFRTGLFIGAVTVLAVALVVMFW